MPDQQPLTDTNLTVNRSQTIKGPLTRTPSKLNNATGGSKVNLTETEESSDIGQVIYENTFKTKPDKK